MNDMYIAQWQFLLPEVVLACSIIAMALSAVAFRRRYPAVYSFLAGGGLLVAIALLFPARSFVGGEIRADQLSWTLRLMILLTGFVMVALFSAHTDNDPARKEGYGSVQPELMILMMGVVLASSLLVMASGMVLFVLSIEMLSVLSYLLTALRIKDPLSAEASYKYILFGAMSTALLLLGLSYMFALNNSMDLEAIGRNAIDTHGRRFVFFASVVLILAGLGYKIAAFPFHAWSPDVFQAVPLPVAALFSTVPKFAAVGFLLRFFLEWLPMKEDIALLLSITGMLTMTFANLAALQQRNLKRLLAYSSIAHGGFVLSVFAAHSSTAIHAIIFYMIAYAIMNLGAFTVLIAVLSEDDAGTERFDIAEIAGIGRMSGTGSAMAIFMAFFLFSLTGLPPFVGFTGKFLIFSALVESGLWPVAVVGAINSLLSFYYYARILHAMFFKEREGEGIAVPAHLQVMVAALGGATIFLGIFPGIFPGLLPG